MTLQDKLNDSINKTFQKSISTILKLCESEIEKIFLLKIMDYVIKRPDRFSLGFIFKEEESENKDGFEYVSQKVNYYLPDGFGRLDGVRIYNLINNEIYIDIIPQKEIAFFDLSIVSKKIKYRLDFGIYKCSIKNSNEILRKYCIECDGYDFHSSKDQIKKDNTRMLDLLLKENYTTIRYLGTTIFSMKESEIGEVLMNFTSDNN